MNTLKLTVLEPDFYKDFACVGDNCRSSCCVHPWIITVDKANYKRVRGLREPKWLAEHFGIYYKRDTVSEKDTAYAQLLYDGSKGCKLQTEEGLCRLQAELGEQYLCHTCRTYPRNNYLLADRKVVCRSLCFSCEEVARLLLSKASPIMMSTYQLEVALNRADPFYATTGQRTLNSPLADRLGEIYGVCLALLQLRDYPMDSRMMLLCVYLDKLAVLERENRAADLAEENNRFVAAVQEGLYDDLLGRDFSGDAAVTLAFYSAMRSLSNIDVNHLSIAELLNKGMQVDHDERIKKYNEFFAGREYFIENLMVARFGNALMPFGNDEPIWKNAMLFACTYTTLRFLLSAAIAGGAATDTEIIDLVAYYGKRFLHNSTAMEDNVKLMELNGYTTLAHMLALIKG